MYTISDKPTFIDLFCGAGGLSLGFTQEGYEVSFANDFDSSCIETYSYNHPDVPREYIKLGDIKDVIPNLDDSLRYNSTDIVIGGPPCQGFSMANRQRLIDDPRNKLYQHYIEVVKLQQPKFFVMENVKGMASVAKEVVEDFESIGYEVSYKILKAQDFGVPQNRERLVFIGNRLKIDNRQIFEKLEITSQSIKRYVLKDALYGLKPLQASRKKNTTNIDSEESGKLVDTKYTEDVNDYIQLINQNKKYDYVYNHKARYNNDRDIEIFSRLNPGDNSTDPKIADIMPYTSRNKIFKDKYYKLDPNKISKTITAHMKFDCNMYIHPTQSRGLTPREAARVQSYPDDYVFKGAYTKTYMQIGNSVPPLMSRYIAKVIKEYL